MSSRFNHDLVFWGIGVIQPATMEEVLNFLKIVYPDISSWPDKHSMNKQLSTWLDDGYVIYTNRDYGLLCLTQQANYFMPKKLRWLRDKARINLLRITYDANLKQSESVVQESVGVAPSLDNSLTLQEGSRPEKSGAEPSRTESTRRSSRFFWPRVSEQLNNQVGLDFHASDIPQQRYTYCSFPTLKKLHEASHGPKLKRDMTISQLAIAIGISARLLTSFTHKPSNHYRSFSIGKRGGGERNIDSPRYFLKAIQYWLKTYVLCYLRVHDSCHAYVNKKSIITNAVIHSNTDFVANVDIENFFGSITIEHVVETLIRDKVGPTLSSAVSKLITYKGVLPQGAPTSPLMSNSYLYTFDKQMSQYCESVKLNYTRYADDISISGSNRSKVIRAVSKVEHLLKKYDLRLNESKTRIASKYASQKVTGLVVNEIVQPPRKYLRKIRAIFHNAHKNPEKYKHRINELYGYTSYLMSFPNLRDSRHLQRYKMTITKIKAISKGNI